MKERLLYLKATLLKKCPTYDTDEHLKMVRQLASAGDAEASEYLTLRAAAYALREHPELAIDPELDGLLRSFPKMALTALRHTEIDAH